MYQAFSEVELHAEALKPDAAAALLLSYTCRADISCCIILARLPEVSARLEVEAAELEVVDVVPEPVEVDCDAVPLAFVPLVLAGGGGGGGPPSLRADRKLAAEVTAEVTSLRSDISCCMTSPMLLESSSRLEVIEAELVLVDDVPPAPPAPCMPWWWWWPPPPMADSAADADVVPVVPDVLDMSPSADCNCCRRPARLVELSARLEVVDAELAEAVVGLLPLLTPPVLPLSPEGGGGGGPSPKLL